MHSGLSSRTRGRSSSDRPFAELGLLTISVDRVPRHGPHLLLPQAMIAWAQEVGAPAAREQTVTYRRALFRIQSHMKYRLPAEKIEPLLFREIMILPFAIEPAGTPDAESLLGSKLMKNAGKIVGRSKHWKRVDDRRLHLPEDNAQADKSKEDKTRRLRAPYEEFVYFEPYVQRFLYGRAGDRDQEDAFQLYRRTDVKKIKVAFQSNTERVHTLAVERCNLYVFETGNVFLVLEIRHEKVEEDKEPRRLTLADCQTIMESLRRVFPPFFTEKGWKYGDRTAELEASYYASSLELLDRAEQELRLGECGHPIRPTIDAAEAIGAVFKGEDGGRMGSAPVFAPWRALLAPLTIKGVSKPDRRQTVQLSQLGDDRAFTMALVGVPDSRQIRESDWACLHQVDGPGQSWPYAPDFIKEWSRGRIYDRFFSRNGAEWQSLRYLICNYAFVMVGSVSASEDGKPAIGDVFCHLLGRHFRRQYFQLVLIAYLHKTALKTLADRLAEAVQKERAFFRTSSDEEIGQSRGFRRCGHRARVLAHCAGAHRKAGAHRDG